MQFAKDILSFLQSLSVIDFILYFAVLILMILVISLIYIIKNGEFDEPEEKKPVLEDEPINLQEIVNTIEENPEPLIDMTAYEAEQEEKAIISYEELIQNAKRYPINYDKEELIDNEVKVKKINLDALTNPVKTEEMQEIEVPHFTYEREEAFLKTLKQLNELLN